MAGLFDSFTLRGLTLPNRIAMAPMTRNFALGGVPGADIAEYYRKRAAGGTGLIITEGTGINRPEARNDSDIPRFHDEDALAGWSRVVEQVHAEGAKIAPQLWHTGIVPAQFAKKPRPGVPEGPSGLMKPGEEGGKAMSEEDVADTIAAFASAAADAVRLGFDIIELHGAHGYLIDQFFWAAVNQRKDQWGGASIGERSRFAAEVVKQVRAAIGDVPLIIRVSQWKQQDFAWKVAKTPDELVEWLGPLAEAGVDMFHCSQRRFWEPEFPELDGEKGLNFAGWTKKQLGLPTMSVGSVSLDGDFFGAFAGQDSQTSDLTELERRLDAEEFDMVSIGRALIANPDWANLVRTGQSDQLKGFDASMLAQLN